MLDFFKRLLPSKQTFVLNAGAVLIFLLPLLIYATYNNLKLDLITIFAPFGYGIFFEKAKSFIRKKVSFFGE